ARGRPELEWRVPHGEAGKPQQRERQVRRSWARSCPAETPAQRLELLDRLCLLAFEILPALLGRKHRNQLTVAAAVLHDKKQWRHVRAGRIVPNQIIMNK